MELRNISERKLKLIRLCIIIFFGLLLFSCKENRPERYSGVDYFVKQSDIGLFGDNNNIFRYNDADCQIAFNKGRKMLRLQTDEQIYYVNIVFGSLLNASNEVVNIEIDYKTQNNQFAASLEMIVVKMDDEKYWLWNENTKTGIILPIKYGI